MSTPSPRAQLCNLPSLAKATQRVHLIHHPTPHSSHSSRSELEQARSNGIDPKEFVVGFDALAVFVHPDNPKTEFTLSEGLSDYVTVPVDNIYSLRGAQWAGWKIVRTNRRFHVLRHH